MLGAKLADQIGASALLYAAIAYFVFDEAYFLEDISDNNPELLEELTWWCEDIYSTFYKLFENLRTFYETTEPSTGSPKDWRARRPFHLLSVIYWEPDENVFITASRNQSDYKLGNQWRVLNERSESAGSDRANTRATIRIPVRRRWTAPSF
ncbi:hypothetical protein D3C87_364130 [compost metagenome]